MIKSRIFYLKSYFVRNWQIFLILVVASFFRLYKISDYMTFLGDEGRDVLVVYNILHGHLTLLGPTSSVGGFFLGPIYYYFMAPFLWLFNYNPVGPAVGIALIGIFTVWLMYEICVRFFNKRVAIVASFLYAISPLVVTYSRSSWNPNPMPFMSLVVMLVAFYAVKNNSLKMFASIGFLMGIAMQLHYLELFFGAGVFIYILFTTIYKVNVKTSFTNLLKRYFVAFIGFLVGWSPFLAFEIRHDFIDFKNVFNFVIHSGETGVSSNFFSIIYDIFFRLFARTIFSFPAIEHTQKYSSNLLWFWGTASVLIGTLASIYLFYRFYKSLKAKNTQFYFYSFLIIWLLSGIILFGFYKKSIYDYYLEFLFPLPFILFSLFLDFIWKNKRIPFSKIIIIALLFIVTVLNFRDSPFTYEPNSQLQQMQTIAKFVNDKTENKPFNFALLAPGNSDHAYRYFFTIWDHKPTTIVTPDKDPSRKSVTGQLFVVCESSPCEPLGDSLWEIAGFGRAEIEEKWKVSVVEVYKLVPYKGNDSSSDKNSK